MVFLGVAKSTMSVLPIWTRTFLMLVQAFETMVIFLYPLESSLDLEVEESPTSEEDMWSSTIFTSL